MNAFHALLLFAGWTLLLMFVAVNWRVFEILRGKPANSWSRGSTTEVPAVIKRMEHAHLNCLENLPIFGAIVLTAAAMNKTAVVDPYAPIVLYARLAQSLVHLIGTQSILVLVRAGFFVVQVVLFALMLWKLLA